MSAPKAPAEVEASLREAFAALQAARFDQALEGSRPFLEDPGFERQAKQIHAAALAALHRSPEALPLVRRVLELQPEDFGALIRLLAVLDSLSLYDEVETRARAALGRGRDAPQLRLLLARALAAQGKTAEAETVLGELVDRAPAFIEAQEAYANVVWSRTGDKAKAMAKLDAALARGAPYPIRVLKAELLNYAGDKQAAYDDLAAALAAPGAPPELHFAACQMAVPLDPALAAHHAEASRARFGEIEPVLLGLCEARLAEGRGAEAEALALKLLKLTPDDQHAVAILATAQRLQGKPGWQALYDYDAFVGVHTLDTPEGWSDLPSFLADARTALEALHTTVTHPIGQSVRDGTQTTRDLLTSTDPVIKALFRALDGPIRRHIAGLGVGTDPVRRRNRGGYAYSGTWSVRLRAGGGRHVDHVHPAGWLSSACYIDVPPAAQGDDKAGWLRFGQPGQPTRPDLAPDHFVRPEPGRLVLFPSYMWHGVNRFAGDQPRLTVAFDLVPAETTPFGPDPAP